MEQFLFKIKTNYLFYGILFLIITGLATLSSYLYLNYTSIHLEMQNQMNAYKDEYIYLAYPDQSIKKELKKEAIVAYYKYDYVYFDGELQQVVITNHNGVKNGIPYYDSNFQLILLPQGDYKEGIYYSSSNRTGCSYLENIKYPKDLFVKHNYPKELIFKIDDSISLDADYYIINSIELHNKLVKQNSINVPFPSSFVGDGTYAKNSLNQNTFYIFFSILSLLPLLFSTIIFHIISKYHIERMQQEIKIRMIYFSSQSHIRKQVFLEQFTLIGFSVILSSILSSIILLGNLSFPHLLLHMISILAIYSLLCYHNVYRAVKAHLKNNNWIIKEVVEC